MAKVIEGLYYTESHEYVKVDGNVGTIGITDYAQNALGNVVYVDMPDVDDEVEAGEEFGAVESVKAASDLNSPVSGKVVEVNGAWKISQSSSIRMPSPTGSSRLNCRILRSSTTSWMPRLTRSSATTNSK